MSPALMEDDRPFRCSRADLRAIDDGNYGAERHWMSIPATSDSAACPGLGPIGAGVSSSAYWAHSMPIQQTSSISSASIGGRGSGGFSGSSPESNILLTRHPTRAAGSSQA